MIYTSEELKAFSKKQLDIENRCEYVIKICIGSNCEALGSLSMIKNFQNKNAESNYNIKFVGCNGLCSEAIIVSKINKKEKKESMYGDIKANDFKKIDYFFNNDFLLEDNKINTNQKYFTKQHKIVLKNAGKINPNKIEDYISHDGYQALFKCLETLESTDVINEIKQSGLRGRGGGGYSTGLKWETVSKVPSDEKYIICNGDEGDPGAFMDRAIMEADPHKVIEGMIIAGYACGATKGYLYIRAEYPTAIEKLNQAIKQCKEFGILGNCIASSAFSFNLEVRIGGGAFVCGEATALINSAQGGRGTPRQKPPHLGESGLFGKPTLLNNVETFANISSIILNGSSWYQNIGTKKSTGTKVFALSGHIKNAGLVEIPMGLTLRELIYDIGGGVTGTGKLKAIQTGGPSGGCLPISMLDTIIDYESLSSVGSIMGSGGLIVLDDSSNMVEIARFFMDFSQGESCGKCVPCRVGTVELRDLLDKFIAKKATLDDFELLKNLSEVVQNSSLCGLGQTAPSPVLSTIKYFEEEYLEGIIND